MSIYIVPFGQQQLQPNLSYVLQQKFNALSNSFLAIVVVGAFIVLCAKFNS